MLNLYKQISGKDLDLTNLPEDVDEWLISKGNLMLKNIYKNDKNGKNKLEFLMVNKIIISYG